METVKTNTNTNNHTNTNTAWWQLCFAVAKQLRVEVVVDPTLDCSGKSKGLDKIFLRNGGDLNTSAHELTHVLQRNALSTMGCFTTAEDLKAWLVSKEIVPDEKYFLLTTWKLHQYVVKGELAAKLLKYELLAYYVSDASNGYEAFKALCKEYGISGS
jgi:hypothetical protein